MSACACVLCLRDTILPRPRCNARLNLHVRNGESAEKRRLCCVPLVLRWPLRHFSCSRFFPASPTNGGFVANRPIPVGGSPYSNVAADVNHDGIADLLIADGTTTTKDSSGVNHQTIQGIVVMLGKGDGTFGAPVHYLTANSASFICVADVNGDGNLDAITVDFDHTVMSPGGKIEILLATATEASRRRFRTRRRVCGCSGVYPADVNGAAAWI